MIFGIHACSGFNHAQIPSFTFSGVAGAKNCGYDQTPTLLPGCFLTGKFPEVCRTDPNGPARDLGVPKRGGFGDVAEAKKIQAIFMEFF